MTTDEIKQLATEYGYCCRHEVDDNICDEARLKLYSAIDEMVVKPKWATFRDWLISGGYISVEDDGCPTELLREMVAWEAARK